MIKKPEWEKRWDNDFWWLYDLLRMDRTEKLADRDFENIKANIFFLLKEVIDEIELEQGEFHTSPIDERFDAGYDKAVSDHNKIKLENKKKWGIPTG